MTAQNQPIASVLTEVTISEAMRPGVITCLPDASLPTMAATMVTHGIHALVVSPEGKGAPLIVTDLELLRAAREQADGVRAADIAREPIATLSTDATLEEATEMMAVRYIAHLLAVDPGSGAPAGIVSSLDVAAVVGGVEPRLARMLRPAPARPSPSARALSDARVSDVMHPGVATCPPEASISTVARVMADHRVHCVAVAGIDGTSGGGQHLTWGLIEDIDLMGAVHRHAVTVPAGTIAVTAPAAVQDDESLDLAAGLMVEHGTRHVVAVGRSGLPSGIVSTLDVATILAADQ